MLLRVVFEAICARPSDAIPVSGRARDSCPISEHQFQVAAAAQISIESVQEQVRSLLVGRIVVGFAIDDDLKVLGISRSDLMVRDIQLHFDAERCSEPDLRGSELPALNDDRQVHSLNNLARCVLGRSIQEGPHSVLVDARATMELYLRERDRIERKTW